MTNANSISISIPAGMNGDFLVTFARSGKGEGGRPYLLLRGIFLTDEKSSAKIAGVLRDDLLPGVTAPNGGFYGIMLVDPNGDLFDLLAEESRQLLLKGVNALMSPKIGVSVEVNLDGEEIGKPRPEVRFSLLSVEGIELASAGDNVDTWIVKDPWLRGDDKKGASKPVPTRTIGLAALKAAALD